VAVESTSCIATLSVISSARLPGSSPVSARSGYVFRELRDLELAQRKVHAYHQRRIARETLLLLARLAACFLQHPTSTGTEYSFGEGTNYGIIVPRSGCSPAVEGFNPDDTGDFQGEPPAGSGPRASSRSMAFELVLQLQAPQGLLSRT